MRDAPSIEPMQDTHWDAVAQIYREGLATGDATFEQDVPSWEEWDRSHLLRPRLIARVSSSIVGWAALSPVSARRVYAGVAEVSVYVGASHHGRGLGRLLLQELIAVSELQGIWTLQAVTFPENTASVALHTKLGFREVGVRERLGQMNGIWRDVLLLERRSANAGQ